MLSLIHIYMYTVNQSDTIKSFYDISYDIEAFSYATYITKLVEGSTCENQTNNRLFILLAQTLYLYTQENTDKKFITRAFELKFLDYIGFRPVVNRCSSCGSKSIKSAIFNIYEGGLLCDLCLSLIHILIIRIKIRIDNYYFN